MVSSQLAQSYGRLSDERKVVEIVSLSDHSQQKNASDQRRSKDEILRRFGSTPGWRACVRPDVHGQNCGMYTTSKGPFFSCIIISALRLCSAAIACVLRHHRSLPLRLLCLHIRRWHLRQQLSLSESRSGICVNFYLSNYPTTQLSSEHLSDIGTATTRGLR